MWISPAIPTDLEKKVRELGELDGRPIEWVEAPELANVRIEPNPDRPLSSWVYAVVAPFPTTEDQIALRDLRQAWTISGQPILVSHEVEAEMAPLLGNEPGPGVSAIAEAGLLDAAWAGRPVTAIVPFEQLDPSWKVLRLEDQSPLDQIFDPATYPLAIDLGLSGESESMDLVEAALDWPTTNRDPEKMAVVLMTGVSALVRATAWRMDRFGAEYPGLKIGDLMREADLTHVSHEVAFAEDCPVPDPVQPTLRFCSAPRHLALFDDLDIDIIELTGNHVADWGSKALLYTLDQYEARGMVAYAGGRNLAEAREPALFELNGNSLAFVGCNAAGPAFSWATDRRPGSLSCSDEGLMERVDQLSDAGYIVIFTFQWPESESSRPLPSQVDAFRQAVDAGATIVNGSQAHRPQSMEFYGDGFIHYGLGNLFFDQMQKLPLRQEFLDRHVFYDGRHINTELITAMLEDYAQPRPTTPDERQALLQEIFSVSGW